MTAAKYSPQYKNSNSKSFNLMAWLTMRFCISSGKTRTPTETTIVTNNMV